jgi:hypothetical protein
MQYTASNNKIMGRMHQIYILLVCVPCLTYFKQWNIILKSHMLNINCYLRDGNSLIYCLCLDHESVFINLPKLGVVDSGVTSMQDACNRPWWQF